MLTTMKIVVGTTLAAFAMEDKEIWASWVANAERVRAYGKSVGADVGYFAALEVDARGTAPFAPLVARLDQLDGVYWHWRLDDGRTAVTTANRLRHITLGQNLAVEHANATGADWLLFLAADVEVPDDVIPKLLELDHPLCGPEIPTYGLTGPSVDRYDFPVEEQLISAGAIFVRRDVFKVLRWRYDLELGMSDDPAYRHDAATLLGVPSYVRKDCVARHHPEVIGPVETRYPARDMKVYR
jgi:hypothetical protein